MSAIEILSNPVVFTIIIMVCLYIGLAIISPSLFFLTVRIPYYELRFHQDNFFLKRSFKSQNTKEKVIDMGSIGTFVLPYSSDQYMIKGICKIVNYDKNNVVPISRKEPDNTPIAGKKKKITKDFKTGEYKEVMTPVKYYPQFMNPLVLKELLKDDSVRKVIKQPKTALEAWYPIIIVVSILVFGVLIAYMFSKGMF